MTPLRLADEPADPGIRGGSVSVDTRVRELRNELASRLALLALAESEALLAIGGTDPVEMCAAASRVQSVACGIGEAARTWQRSIL